MLFLSTRVLLNLVRQGCTLYTRPLLKPSQQSNGRFRSLAFFLYRQISIPQTCTGPIRFDCFPLLMVPASWRLSSAQKPSGPLKAITVGQKRSARFDRNLPLSSDRHVAIGGFVLPILFFKFELFSLAGMLFIFILFYLDNFVVCPPLRPLP